MSNTNPSHYNVFLFRRVRQLADLPISHGRKPSEDDYTVYERLACGDFRRAFLQVSHSAKRIYYDADAEDELRICQMELGSMARDEAEEKHDKESTQYVDFSEAARFFKGRGIYIQAEFKD